MFEWKCVIGLQDWLCACGRACLCVWECADFILFYYEIVILKLGFLKSNISDKVPTLPSAYYCVLLQKCIFKWRQKFTPQEIRNSRCIAGFKTFFKLKEEIVTELVLLHREVFWQEGSSGTSSHNFSKFSSRNISHKNHNIPTQRKILYK